LKKNLIVSIAIFVKDVTAEGLKVWVQERLEAGSLYGKLEFPGGKIESGETPEMACRREVLEEVGVDLDPEEKLVLFKYQTYSYENKNICLHVFISKFDNLPENAGRYLEITYKDKSKYLEGRIPPINHVIIDDLAVYIQSQFSAGQVKTIWQQ
jgi:8-oxo-dGTP diphosphatase